MTTLYTPDKINDQSVIIVEEVAQVVTPLQVMPLGGWRSKRNRRQTYAPKGVSEHEDDYLKACGHRGY